MWIIIAATAVAVCAVTWIVASIAGKNRFSGELAESDRKAVDALARLDEMRKTVESAASDFDTLREKLTESEKACADALARKEEVEKAVAQQQAMLDEAKVKLSDAFNSLAAKALAGNNQGFLTLAEESFKKLSEQAKSDLDHRKTAIDDLVKPLAESLAKYQKEARDLEERRLKDISSVGEQLRSLAMAQTSLQNETAKLVNALKSPQVRGRWGEIALRKTAELAGMTQHCDFVEQESVSTEDGRLRPDMIVKLPGGREVVVDSKVPLAAFMEALEAVDDASRTAAFIRHKNHFIEHISKLSNKKYWEQFATPPDSVIMFIPNDSFLAAAVEQDPNLLESALTKGVIIATPATFIALLRAIAFGWRQELINENAEQVRNLAQELADRLATMTSHLASLGNAIRGSVKAYNDAVGSFESRVLTQARRFKELGAPGKKDIEELPVIDSAPRVMSLPVIESKDESLL